MRNKYQMAGILAVFMICAPVVAARASGIPWVPFHWASLTSNGKSFPKAAILVPVKIRSYPETYYMEFDTGSRPSPFRKVPQKVQQELLGIYKTPKTRQDVMASFKEHKFHLALHIGKTEIFYSGIMIKTAPPADMSAPYPMIGTLGQNAFYNKVVFVDYVHGRIAFISPKNIKKSYFSGVSFVPMDYRNNRLFIPVTINHHHYSDSFFYDSGSSLFPLIATRTLWGKLTGRSADDPKNSALVVSAFGRPITMTGAKLKGEMSIGSVTIKSPMVYFQKSGGWKQSNLDYAKYPVKGTIGNAPFYNCCMIVVDMPDHRFGIKKVRQVSAHPASTTHR